MAEPNAILNSDKSAAPTVALSLICALIVVELVAGARGLWGIRGLPVPASATNGAATATTTDTAPLPGAPAPGGGAGQFVIPPLPRFSTPIPSVGGGVAPTSAPILVPPPPVAAPPSAGITAPRPLLPPATRTTLPPSVTASSSVRVPSNRMILPPSSRVSQPLPSSVPPSSPTITASPPSAPTMAPSQTASFPPPAAPASPTGNPQADELLEVAAQSRDLGDHAGALQALNRADLLVPNNPRIMREKALTLQRLGKTEEAQSLQSQPSSAPPSATGSSSLRPTSLPNHSGPNKMPSPASSGSPSSSSGPSSSTSTPSPRELLNKSFGTRAAEPPPEVSAAPPAAAVNGALSLGQCRIERDPSVVRGERLSLKVPLIAAPGEVIDPNQMILDVMFYDKVNNERIELTMADKPKSGYETAGDFKTGHEVISVLYNLPEFTPAEISELGRHTFYGYIVKLYYKNRLMGAVATPPELSTMGESGQGKRI